MGDKLFVGPMAKGLKTNPLAFYIDNDSFPELINAYPWRGRVKRRRGDETIGRLNRQIGTTDGSGNFGPITITPLPTQGFSSFQVVAVSQTDIFTDTGATTPVATMISTNAGASASLNLSTGAFSISTSQPNSPVFYFPGLPAMGLPTFNASGQQFPTNLAFDTDYAYTINSASTYGIADASFYLNPPGGSINGATYTAKSTATPLWWNGQNYQQFWGISYANALWITNGIKSSTDLSTTGMQFKAISTVDNITGGPPAVARLHIAAHGLVKGDWVFVNEVMTTTGINFQTGFVSSNDPQNPGFVDVTFPYATIATNGTGGIAQYLTNTASPTKDSLRWYGSSNTSGTFGFVNFAPPLFSATPTFGIDDLPPAQYYLVGAIAIFPFKDRLMFFGPVVQTSTTGPFYLADCVVFSAAGTPFYTASFTNNPTILSATTVFHPTSNTEPWPFPQFQTGYPPTYFEDVDGFGGNISNGSSQPITTVGANEDVLIVGFTNKQTRFVYTGNDLLPFNFFTINSELGSGSTFSAITLDRGVLSTGDHGIIQTSQIGSQRIDLDIPDQIFSFNLLNNGLNRICAGRDFINEWIYWSYSFIDDTSDFPFPSQTLLYNYRDGTWATFNENITCYGQFRKTSGDTWATLPPTLTWKSWDDPWSSGESDVLQPQVVAGNAQGYIFFRDEGTEEGVSGTIQNIASGTVTSPNNCLNDGDFIVITGAVGTVGQFVNGKTFQVTNPNYSANTFTTTPIIGSGTYLGGAVFTRIYVPFVQSKQFPTYWELGRKTRLGWQQYLFSKTDLGQVTLNIYLSQTADFPSNAGSIVPGMNVINGALIYSTLLYTCPENQNLGLTAANVNLQMPGADNQQQIWHRMNTSLLGDTVQVAFTLSSDQVYNLTATGIVATITGATNAAPCVLTVVSSTGFAIGDLVQISGVNGMTQLDNPIPDPNTPPENDYSYQVTAVSPTSITINWDTTTFGTYTSGGVVSQVANFNNFAEIELHGFSIDVQPSQLLS